LQHAFLIKTGGSPSLGTTKLGSNGTSTRRPDRSVVKADKSLAATKPTPTTHSQQAAPARLNLPLLAKPPARRPATASNREGIRPVSMHAVLPWPGRRYDAPGQFPVGLTRTRLSCCAGNGIRFQNSCEVGVFAGLTNAYCIVPPGAASSNSFYRFRTRWPASRTIISYPNRKTSSCLSRLGFL
jgi:hypothetical protein